MNTRSNGNSRFISNTLLPAPLSYYGYDGHGNVRLLMDTNGNITDTYAYDAYASLIASNEVTPNDIPYSGQRFDPYAGLYYNRARHYASDLGIFTSRDADYGNHEDLSSLHKYLYAEDDPVNLINPSGNIPIVSNWIYGGRVERAIAAHFLEFGPPGDKTPPLFTPISTILHTKYIPGLTASRPDLVLLPGSTPGSPGQIWEIKPAGSFLEGETQLWFYLAILNTWDREHRWVPGSTYVPPSVIPLDPLVFAIVGPSVGGVILYQVEDLRATAALIGVFIGAEIEAAVGVATLNEALAE